MSTYLRTRVLAALLVCTSIVQASTVAEKCLLTDQTWTPPSGLTSVSRVVVVGSGAAGGADASGNFGKGGQNEPVGGSTAGTSWGAGGAAGAGAGGGAAGSIVEQSNVALTGPVSVKVGRSAQTAGATGEQSCFGANCANGGSGGGAFTDFTAVGGGQAGWGGAQGASAKTSATQEFGTVYAGTTSSGKAITVVNNSGASATFQAISVPSGVSISSDNCSGNTIAKGGSCSFTAAVTIASSGEFSKTVLVRTERGILTVPVHATGVPPPTCGLPWGGTIANGQAVTAYSTTSVPYGSSCPSQTRTCSNGSLSGSYSYSYCNEDPGANCSLPWGGSISSGNSVTAYAATSVPYGSTCSSQTRSCSNGSLSGSYSKSSCSVQAAASCSLPWGGSISSGNSVTAYSTSSGTSCPSQTRSCSNGSLSGSYSYSSCTVVNPTWQIASTTTACVSSFSGSSGTLKSGSCSPIGTTNERVYQDAARGFGGCGSNFYQLTYHQVCQ